MTIGSDLEQRLDDWMQEDMTLPDDLDEVIARLPETPQRRHRWSITFTGSTWRTRTMLTATRVAATIAIFTLGVSVALLAATLGPSSEPLAGQPAAESPIPPTVVSGSAGRILLMDFGNPAPEDGIPTLRDNVSVSEPEMDDPRVDGEYRLTQSGQNYGDMGPMWGTMRVENDDGAWEGRVAGYFTENETNFSGCLIGESAYEGLTYCLRAAADVERMDVDFDGVVYQGDLPPLD